MPTDLTIIRIVVVSPSDNADEKDRLATVVSEINRGLSTSGVAFRLELRSWEIVPPGLHREGPQGLIDTYLDSSESDIVVGIFSRRFGTPVLDAQSGTEHEIRRAVKHWLDHHSPDVKLYFNVKPFSPSQDDLVQYAEVLRFKTEFMSQGVVREYDGPEHFENLIRFDLLTTCFRRLSEGPISSSANSPFLLLATATVQTARREGLTEAIGPIEITLQGTPSASDLSCECDVYVALNTNVTSRLIGDGNSMVISDIEETSTLGVKSFTIKGPPLPALLDATLSLKVESGELSTIAAIEGKLVALNLVLFESVTFDAKRGRKAEITGLRANTYGIPRGASVMALVSVKSLRKPAEVRILNSSLVVARSFRGSEFHVRSKNGGRFTRMVFRQSQGHNLDLQMAETDFELHFRELFPSAFKCRAQESNAGTADYGSILLAHFGNVSPNLELYVSKYETGVANRESAKAVFMPLPKYSSIVDLFSRSQDPDLFKVYDSSGATEYVLPSGVSIVRVPLIKGAGYIAWEWVSTAPDIQGYLNEAGFGVLVSFRPGSYPHGAHLGTSLVKGTLAPISIQAWGCSAPIPRFANTGAWSEIFSILP